MFKKQKRKRLKKNKKFEGRLYFVMAIVFLLAFASVARLYALQVSNYDLYIALASAQHKVSAKLEAKRGKIFIQNSTLANDYYPMASNKEFATVYIVPKDIKEEDKENLANKLYEIFDKKEVEKEVDELLDSDDYFLPIKDSDRGDAEKIKEFKEVKREKEIELRKKEILEKYFAKINKKNDPYEAIKKKISDEELAEIKKLNIKGLDYVMENYRYYPENEIGSHFLGFVDVSDGEKQGHYGLEGFFNKELRGIGGMIKTEKSANGKLIIINDRQYKKPKNGTDLILTINRPIQFEACQKLKESVEKHEADGGTVLVMDPFTGAIIAMCSYPDYNPNSYWEVEDIDVYNNPAIFNQYEPGSIFKVITMAAGIDSGAVKPDTIYNDKGFLMIEGWDKPIKNSDFESHGGHGWVDMNTVLEESLNTGSIFVMQKTGEKRFAQYVEKFGFGEKTGIELETEAPGNIVNLKRKRMRPVEVATASFGQGITVTPLQIANAYSAIVNGGILMKPFLVKRMIFSDGTSIETRPKQLKRVISERSAMLVSAMMVNVVDGGHAKRAGVKGYYVGGKTGTAQVADKEKKGYSDKTIHTFVGFAPSDKPRFVMLVKLDDPKDVRYSASSAAPLFGQIAEFILNYLQVPKER